MRQLRTGVTQNLYSSNGSIPGEGHMWKWEAKGMWAAGRTKGRPTCLDYKCRGRVVWAEAREIGRMAHAVLFGKWQAPRTSATMFQDHSCHSVKNGLEGTSGRQDAKQLQKSREKIQSLLHNRSVHKFVFCLGVEISYNCTFFFIKFLILIPGELASY